MVERLVLTLLLVLLGITAYYFFKRQHLRRVPAWRAHEERPLLLYFRSDYCPPCTTQARFLDQLPSTIASQIAIEKIDVEKEKNKADEYGVFTLPTTLLLDPSGVVRHINYGLTEPGKLARQVESVL
jgi:thioredoxin 1